MTEARKFGPEGGIVGPFANRNSFATFLGMGLILALSLVLSQQNAHQNPPTRALGVIGGLVAVLVLLLALFATQSRMGVAASLIGATIALLSQPRHRIIGGLGALIALGVLAFVTLGHGIADRFSLIAVDWQIRLDFYRQIADLIALRPFAGYGADGFALAYEAAHRPPVSADFVWDRAHSTYLKLWLEYGLVIGSLPVIGAIACFVALICQAWRPGAALVRAGAGALVMVGLHSTLDFSLEILANQLLLCLLLAVALGQNASHADRRE